MSARRSSGQRTRSAKSRPDIIGGQPLDAGIRQRLESGFGESLADVRVVTGSPSGSVTRVLGARAVTMGPQIWLAPGESPADLRLLAHEAAHVLQQRRGEREPPRTATSGTEHAARTAAGAALSGRTQAMVAAPVGPQCQERGGPEPAVLDYPQVEVRGTGDQRTILVDSVPVAIARLPGGRGDLGVGAMISDDRVSSEAASLLPVDVEIRPGAGVTVELIPAATANMALYGRQLRVRVRDAPARVQSTGKASPAKPAAAERAPAKEAAPPDHRRQELEARIRALEEAVSSNGLSPQQLAQAQQEHDELLAQLEAHKEPQRPAAPGRQVREPPAPLSLNSSVDARDLSGRQLEGEVKSGRDWLASQNTSSVEASGLEQSLASHEGELARRQALLVRSREERQAVAGVQRKVPLLGWDGGQAIGSFIMGFLGGAQLEIPPNVWQRLKHELDEHPFRFQGGVLAGFVEGAAVGVWDNIVGLVELLELVESIGPSGQMRDQIRTATDPAYREMKRRQRERALEIAKSLWELLKAIAADPGFFTTHGGELGEIAGQGAAEWFNEDFMARTTFEKGQTVGRIEGRVILEIAMLFLGPEELILKAGAATRASTGLMKAVRGFMEGIPGLRRLMQVAREGEAAAGGVRGVKAAEEVAQEARRAAQLGEGASEAARSGERVADASGELERAASKTPGPPPEPPATGGGGGKGEPPRRWETAHAETPTPENPLGVTESPRPNPEVTKKPTGRRPEARAEPGPRRAPPEPAQPPERFPDLADELTRDTKGVPDPAGLEERAGGSASELGRDPGTRRQAPPGIGRAEAAREEALAKRVREALEHPPERPHIPEIPPGTKLPPQPVLPDSSLPIADRVEYLSRMGDRVRAQKGLAELKASVARGALTPAQEAKALEDLARWEKGVAQKLAAEWEVKAQEAAALARGEEYVAQLGKKPAFPIDRADPIPRHEGGEAERAFRVAQGEANPTYSATSHTRDGAKVQVDAVNPATGAPQELKAGAELESSLDQVGEKALHNVSELPEFRRLQDQMTRQATLARDYGTAYEWVVLSERAEVAANELLTTLPSSLRGFIRIRLVPVH